MVWSKNFRSIKEYFADVLLLGIKCRRKKKNLMIMMIFFSYIINTFQQNWKVVMNLVCLSVHALTVLNILQMPWNLCMLFIWDITGTVLKMVHIELMVDLRRNYSNTLRDMKERFLKNILAYLYCTKYYEINSGH